jgi:uncharacterized membrane protein YoaK (UPF0700 family)
LTLIQAILTLAAALLQWVTAPGEITSIPALMIVAMLAFAASGQNSMAVTVGLAELNTSMVTGAIMSIASSPNIVHTVLSANTAIKVSTLHDPRIFDADNPARNRRVFFGPSYAAGCIVGATMAFGTVGSLLIVYAIKLAIGASFLLNRGKAASRFPTVARAGEEHYELDAPVVKASWSD